MLIFSVGDGQTMQTCPFLLYLHKLSSILAFVFLFMNVQLCSQVSEEVERALAKLGPAKLNARYGFTYLN